MESEIMWISKRYHHSTRQLLIQTKQNKVKRPILKQVQKKTALKVSEGIWNILPQGFWLKAESFASFNGKSSSNEHGTEESLLTNLQNVFRRALERQQMIQDHQKRLDTAFEMTNYVGNMMKDYFTTDNLWNIVSKDKDAQKTAETKENTVTKTQETLPKFIEKRREMQANNLYYSQNAIDANTRHCVERLRECSNRDSVQFRLDELNEHLHKFPLSATLANKMGAQKLVWNHFHDFPTMQGLCIEVLGRLGYQEPLNTSPGIRILSIDGGGMKGVLALEILGKLERKTGQKIHQLFDYFIGVSTGSIIIGLLALQKMSVSEVSQIYQDIGAQVFEQTYLKAVTGMVLNQAYYDTLKYETFLKEFAGNDVMASTVRDPESPKVAFVSAIMSSSRHSVSPFIFRNYAMPYMVSSNFRGSSRFKVWEAVRASSAAPGFFDDFRTKGLVFQDGALIANNPANIGLHEAQHLWPKEKLQCLVSLGMGRYEPLLIDPYEVAQSQESLSVKDKFSKLVLSCTDTEMTHYTLRDLLPDDRYFRFNPYLSEITSMDETRLEKIELMRNDSQMYCRRNSRRLDLVSKLTTEKPTYLQRVKRKLLKSAETYSNSLTATAASLLSYKTNSREVDRNSSKVPIHHIRS